MGVPLMDIQAQYGPLRGEIDAAITDVLDTGRFILGPHGRALEAQVGERLAGRPSVGVANGTDALVLALDALGIGPGDEVITTPYTFYATAEAIARVGATPVFADIDPGTYCLDPARAAEKIGPRTRALLPVHIFGHPADMPALMELARAHDLLVVEDCAQAFGARHAAGEIATFGDAATFSFFPTKNFPGMGDGGMVVCRDEELAERVRMLRFHGSTDKVVFERVGYNSRLDDLQAAIIRVFYPHLDGWNAARARAAVWYAEEGLGEGAVLPAVAEGARHIYHLFMVRHPARDALAAALKAAGHGCAVYYGIPMHLQPVFAGLGYREGDFPVAEECARTALALPMHPNLTRDDVAAVAGTARTAAGSPAGV
ncbi:MAG: DegT/DnrJ/EryC1/StrS family aminotransferase [Miltoncostaeaceae bacterium]